MTVRDDMLNGHRIVHGGIVFALADRPSPMLQRRNEEAVAARPPSCSLQRGRRRVPHRRGRGGAPWAGGASRRCGPRTAAPSRIPAIRDPRRAHPRLGRRVAPAAERLDDQLDSHGERIDRDQPRCGQDGRGRNRHDRSRPDPEQQRDRRMRPAATRSRSPCGGIAAQISMMPTMIDRAASRAIVR